MSLLLPGPHQRRGLLLWLAMAALLAAIAVGIASWASADPQSGGVDLRVSLTALGWPVAALTGAAMVGPDYRARLLWSSILIEPSRPHFAALRIGQGAGAAALAGAVLALTPVLARLAGASIVLPPVASLGLVVLFCALAGAVGAALVVAFADHVAAIIAVAAYAVVGEGLLGAFVGPSVELYLPGPAITAIMTGNAPIGSWLVWPMLMVVSALAAVTRLATDDIS